MSFLVYYPVELMQLKYLLMQLFFIFLEHLSIAVTVWNKEMNHTSKVTDLVDNMHSTYLRANHTVVLFFRLSFGESRVIVKKIFHFDMWTIERYFKIFLHLKIHIYVTLIGALVRRNHVFSYIKSPLHEVFRSLQNTGFALMEEKATLRQSNCGTWNFRKG